MATTPTPEQIEAARALVAQADAAEAARKRQETRDLVAPFIAAGWGAPAADESPVRLAARALREKAMTMSSIDPQLPNTLFTTANIMDTVDDKIRSLAALSADPPVN